MFPLLSSNSLLVSKKEKVPGDPDKAVFEVFKETELAYSRPLTLYSPQLKSIP